MKSNVLIFISHYLPGYKIGGPLNSIISITENLEQHFSFNIITSDRDMGDLTPYKGIVTDKWLKLSNIKIKYLKVDVGYYLKVYNELKNKSYDTIYLNSFFDFNFSIFIVFLFKLKLVKVKQIILAPRGELFDEALKFGKLKKKLFLLLAKRFNLYKDIIWHSTAQIETPTIRKLNNSDKIKLVEVLSNNDSKTIWIEDPIFELNEKNFLKVIFLSRISKEKNLIYCIKTLKKISSNIELHIYGPIEDQTIWSKCLNEIKKLPNNICVLYKGIVEPNKVKSIFSKYDLFFFPTHLENYGHVINESLSVGTPVLISDNTPWRKLEEKGLGWDYNLKSRSLFVKVIENFSNFSQSEKDQKRSKTLMNYKNFSNKDILIKKYIKLFNGE